MADHNEQSLIDPASQSVAQADPAPAILVVEDNPQSQTVIEAQLAGLGYPCRVEGDGEAGLKAWRGGTFAAILSDCEMPVMDGFAMARAVRADEARDGLIRIPIIAITSMRAAEVRERCRAAGMDEMLRKPVSPRQLADALKARIGDRLATAKPPGLEASAPSASAAPVLDLTILQETFSGDERRIGEILEQFLAVAGKLVSGIEEQLSAHGAEGLGDASHRLKSSALTVGAFALADVCDALEEAGRSANWAGASSVYPRLAPSLQAVTAAIARRR